MLLVISKRKKTLEYIYNVQNFPRSIFPASGSTLASAASAMALASTAIRRVRVAWSQLEAWAAPEDEQKTKNGTAKKASKNSIKNNIQDQRTQKNGQKNSKTKNTSKITPKNPSRKPTHHNNNITIISSSPSFSPFFPTFSPFLPRSKARSCTVCHTLEGPGPAPRKANALGRKDGCLGDEVPEVGDLFWGSRCFLGVFLVLFGVF